MIDNKPPTRLKNTIKAIKAIKATEGQSGTIECPQCKGSILWRKNGDNGHIWGRCNLKGCLDWNE